MTPKQERFVAEYLIDLNATKAAIRAGYHPKMAAKLVAKSSIATEIATRKARQLERVGLTADDAMRANREQVEFDPIALVGADNNYLPLREIPATARRCIRRIRVHKQNLTSGDGKTDKVIDYEFYDKHPAIALDYKRTGLSKEHVEIQGGIEIRWQGE